MREQIQVYLKSLTLIGYAFDGSRIADQDLAADFLPPLSEVVRNDGNLISTYTPFLTAVTEMDQHAFERDRDRDKDRKKKRGTRARRLVALPDREPVKTNRSSISGGMDENGVPIVLSVIPKLSLPAKTTPARVKTAPRRAAAIAAKASITTMTSELQHDDVSAAPSPEHNVILAVRASRRNRINTGSPEPAKPVTMQLIKEEAVGLGRPPHSGTGPADRPRERPTSSWTCSHCHRPEAVLDDKRRFDGPAGKPNLCSDCSESLWTVVMPHYAH